MNFVLTQEAAHKQAKQLAAYLKSIGTKMPYGTALEAVARMYDSKSWNHLSAKLEASPAPMAPAVREAKPAAQKLYITVAEPTDQVLQEAFVLGECYSWDRVEYDTFDATMWLLTAPEEEVLKLPKNDWALTYTYLELGDALRVWGDDISVAHSYVRDHNASVPAIRDCTNLGVDVDPVQALRVLRAYRYPLFVQLALLASDQDLEATPHRTSAGGTHSLRRSSDGTLRYFCRLVAGQWAYFCQDHYSVEEFDTPEAAWNALGAEAERRGLLDWTTADLKDARAVQPNQLRTTM